MGMRKQSEWKNFKDKRQKTTLLDNRWELAGDDQTIASGHIFIVTEP